MDKYVGKRLDGRYEIQEIIGVGGMAVVYKAFDNQENRIVAVKILKDEFVSNQEFIRRFKNESKAIAMLSHQNIVKVYDVSFGDLIQYIVMEYIEGVTLKEVIERQGSLRWKDAVHFTIQILRGLQHAHDKGIVHRDVKPQNIMVLPDGTIKVTDFGIARFTRSDQRTITDKAIGSVHYISPEQARGEKTDEKSDIYSVGVMLYEMITGQMPFQAESAVSVAIMQLQREPKSPTEINGSIPDGLEQITMRAMQKTPERRYQSSAEMLCDLDAFRKDPSVTFGYYYFVDDSPTKFVGAFDDADEVEEEVVEEEVKEKSSIIPILTGVAVTLVLALVVLAIIFIPKFLNGSTAEIACPDFVGKKYDVILDNAEYVANFKFEDEWDHSADYEYGVVFEQSEKSGEMLKKGAKITLYISMGENTKVVNNVQNKTESAAKTELEAAGFTTEIVEMEDPDIEKGYVIGTEPQIGTHVAPNSKIIIYVSAGKPEKKIAVPDVTLMTEEDAKKKLEEEKFVVKVETIQLGASDEFCSVGTVAKQSPDNTVKDALEGSEVTIYVCEGYKTDVTVSLPDDLNETWGTYSISLWENGTKVHNGDTIDGLARKNYVFKDYLSKSQKSELKVKVSVDGVKWYDYCAVIVDNKTGKQTEEKYTEYKELVDEYKNEEGSKPEVGTEPETSSEPSVSSEPTEGSETQVGTETVVSSELAGVIG